jgi:hypothetical protein
MDLRQKRARHDALQRSFRTEGMDPLGEYDKPFHSFGIPINPMNEQVSQDAAKARSHAQNIFDIIH